MKKEAIRKEFFVLKNEGHSYSQCRFILRAKFGCDFSVRTLKRWVKRLDVGGWDLLDKSRRPHQIYYKINSEAEKKILALRTKTGWGEDKIACCLPELNLSHTSVNKILHKHNCCNKTNSKNRRIKWVRWQRLHPNSLWQIDHTDEQNLFDCYTLSVVDDCSRYSLALVKLKIVTTNNVINILENLIKIHGKPREILTDNGGAYGLNSKHSRFDKWCKKKGIKHIRTKIHSPTTNGKVERIFKTMDEELKFCNNDLEKFRMRYNHYRPHKSLNNQTPAKKYFSFNSLF